MHIDDVRAAAAGGGRAVRRAMPGIGATLALAVALATGASAAGREERLAGTWRATAAQRNGAPAPDLIGHTITFSGSTFRIAKDGQPVYGGTFALPGRSSRWIDFQQTQGPTRRGEWKGLYRVRGQRLDIVDNADDMSKPRPTRFRTDPGSGYVAVRFDRQ